MGKIIKANYFQRSALKVAKELIGKSIVVKRGGKIKRYLIMETEAYVGPHDKASHAFKGKTKRTETMYMSGGVFYVYLIYGFYWMLNIVTDVKDYPSAVLIRGIIEGREKGFRKISGPGKVGLELKISKDLNGKNASKKTGLWFEESYVEKDKYKFEFGKKIKILRLPRVGVGYAGPIWSGKKFRFLWCM